MYADIMVKIDNQNNLLRSQLQVKTLKHVHMKFLLTFLILINLQDQLQAEEQERLRKIQESIEIQRKIKEEEERLIRQEEENRKKQDRDIPFVQCNPNKTLFNFAGGQRLSRDVRPRRLNANVKRKKIERQHQLYR